MASLKQITVGTTSYDIIPSAITDSNANYKASCPTISSNTTVEVASNKTTVINSSSTDTEYPSARAVYTAIKKASKAGSFASNILTSTNTAFVPLVSTSGMFSTTYLQKLSILDNKRIDGISSSSSSIIDFIAAAGKITQFNLASSAVIGDSIKPTADNKTAGQNGLCGDGYVYIAATGSSDPFNSNYAFRGTIYNKAGISNSIKGGYIGSIRNDEYATINSLTNAGTISTLDLISPSSGVSGKITKFYLDNRTTIGDSTTSTESDTTLGCNGLYGNGTVYIAATCTKDPTTSPYAFKGSIVNKDGISSSVQGGYIKSIGNGSYATISEITNAPYSNINNINNLGTITNISNSGSISEIVNTGNILTLKMNGSGTAEILVGQGSTADITIRTSMAVPGWEAVTNGKVNPWEEVPRVESLVTFLNMQTGILYKYTGSTTTYNGVTYTNGNFYRYEA